MNILRVFRRIGYKKICSTMAADSNEYFSSSFRRR
jgi:hypothetical protein